MTTYGYTSEYLTKDGNPWFPMMGEIHYSRVRKADWKKEILKMKAGGIDTISTYVFWLHHEEVEGEYDFTGDRDLRGFVEMVQACDEKLILRIGPWSHGEARNGGFPDWLLKKDFPIRCNHESYFALVEDFYQKTYDQVKGLLLKDGGPIIGVQIENEFGHCGGLQGEEGEAHMRRLREMAVQIGFDVPFYTATGWGGAVTGGAIPVMGGYCEAPWDQRITEIEPSGNYVFTLERNDHNIGSDHGFGHGITFDIDKFPYLTAELGGGLQVTRHRRPVAHAEDIGAMSLTKMGSGVNLLGYYMYHGGTNPEGKLSTLQESRATGYPNDLPELSYDFSAPIREYGQISETFKEIKLLAMFIQEFGSSFCTMKTFLPTDNPLTQNNLEDLRYAIRRNGNQGFLFVNNYQRRYDMAEHKDVTLQIPMENETVIFPEMTIHNREYFFYPINMPVGNIVLKTAKATPLCILHGEKPTYVFYTDKEPAYQYEGELQTAEILTLSREDAKNAYKISLQQEKQDALVITDGCVIEDGGKYQLISSTDGQKEETIRIYPAEAIRSAELQNLLKEYDAKGTEDGFAVFVRKQSDSKAVCSYELVAEDADSRTFEVQVDYTGDMQDCFVQIDFGGDVAEMLIDGKKCADWFYTGVTWNISMKKFDFPKKFQIKIEALREGTPCFLETWPPMVDGVACDIYNMGTIIEQETSFS